MPSFLRRFWLPIALLVVVVFVASAFLLGRHSVYQSYPELSGVERAGAILEKVGKLIELPQGESPQIAVIENAESVRQTQPFLTNAINGDILIVYTNAQMALLYRPSANRLIAVGPVNTEEPPLPPPQPLPEEEIETKNATTTDQ
jgi:hypothetical protein